MSRIYNYTRLKYVIVELLLITIIIFFSIGAQSKNVSDSFSEESVVPKESYVSYRFLLTSGMKAEITVNTDRNVDFYIMNEQFYNNYKDPLAEEFSYYKDKSVERKSQYTVQLSDEIFILVIDNQNLTISGAMSTTDVAYKIEIKITKPTIIDTLFFQAPCYGWIALIIVLIIGTISWLYKVPKEHALLNEELKKILKK